MDNGPTLQEVCEEVVDCVNRTAPEDPRGEFYVIGTPAMRGNTINLREARRVTKDVFDRWTRRLLPRAGDLLLAREAPVGPVVRVPDGGNFAAGQRTTHLRANPEKVDPRFLYYLLASSAVQQRILAGAMGSTVPHLRVADVKSLRLPLLPALGTQRAVADVLGALDDKIAANERVSQSIKHLLAAEFDRMGLIDDSGTSSNRCRIDELVDFNPKTGKPGAGLQPYLEMKNLPDQEMTVSLWTNREAKSGARFTNGDTLLARITPCLENGKTGYVDFLDCDQPVGIGSTEFIVMRPKAGIPPALVYFLATDTEFRAFAIRHMVGTSGRQRVSADSLAGFAINRPDQSTLERFGKLTGPLMELVKGSVDETTRLAQTRDQLLPLLMSGKVTVKEAETEIADLV